MEDLYLEKTSREDSLMHIAIDVALQSEDEVKIGVVISNGGTVLVTAFNELPENISRTVERICEENKLQYTLHAEMNAITKAARRGIKLEGTSVTLCGKAMCRQCAIHLIQTGIASITMPPPDDIGTWKDSTHEAIVLLQEAGVEVKITDRLRGTSHGLNDGTKWVR